MTGCFSVFLHMAKTLARRNPEWFLRLELYNAIFSSALLLPHEFRQSSIPRTIRQLYPMTQRYLRQTLPQKSQNFTIPRLCSTKTRLKGVQTKPRDLALVQWKRDFTWRQLTTLASTGWIEILRQIQDHLAEKWRVVLRFATCNNDKKW